MYIYVSKHVVYEQLEIALLENCFYYYLLFSSCIYVAVNTMV